MWYKYLHIVAVVAFESRHESVRDVIKQVIGIRIPGGKEPKAGVPGIFEQ